MTPWITICVVFSAVVAAFGLGFWLARIIDNPCFGCLERRNITEE